MNSDGISVFVNAAQAGSLSAAARRMGITPMVATRRLATLEGELGVRLMHRTTRSVSLTPEGETFLPFASTMMDTAEAARATIAPSKAGATGLLRVTACGSIGRTVIMPMLPRLLDENPGLRVDFLVTDTVVDIVSTGIDVAIRIAAMKDSSLIASTLAANVRILCASPDYLARRGTPKKMEDLADHDCVTTTGLLHLPFVAGDRERSVRINPRLTASNIEGIHDACIAGAGIGMLSTWHAKPSIEAGRLVAIELEDGKPKELTVSAVFPTNRQLLPKVRVFLDALKTELAAKL